jgi:hypothetical protein
MAYFLVLYKHFHAMRNTKQLYKKITRVYIVYTFVKASITV